MLTRAVRETWQGIVGRSPRALVVPGATTLTTALVYWSFTTGDGFRDHIKGVVYVVAANVAVFVMFLIARVFVTPFRMAAELKAIVGERTLVAIYDERDPTCRDDWKPQSDDDDPFVGSTFRVGIVNLTGSRIEGVRATCGPTNPALTPSLQGRAFFTHPREDDEFAIPVSVGPTKPSLYLNVAYGEVIASTDREGRRTGEVWPRYTIGPARRGAKYVAYGKKVDHVPRFEMTVRVEGPTQTLEIPCVLLLDGRTIRFEIRS